MFQEVRCSICFVGLGSAASIDPHANGGGLGVWRVLSCNLMVLSKSSNVIESSFHTVNPLDRVVLWVVDGRVIGDAKPRFIGWTDFKAARLRRAWLRLKAKRREAIVTRIK